MTETAPEMSIPEPTAEDPIAKRVRWWIWAAQTAAKDSRTVLLILALIQGGILTGYIPAPLKQAQERTMERIEALTNAVEALVMEAETRAKHITREIELLKQICRGIQQTDEGRRACDMIQLQNPTPPPMDEKPLLSEVPR
jgi:hypothetical protein